MADDIARLVIEIDSKGAIKATGNLEKVTKQSGKAETSTKAVRAAAKSASTNFIMLAAKVGAAMLAYRAITGISSTFVENTIKQEQAMR